MKKRSIKKRAKAKEKNKPVSYFDSSSTMLNLALSQLGASGGFARNRVSNIVGDKSTGKTILVLSVLAGIYYDLDKKPVGLPETKTLELIYNNGESVLDFPIDELFGEKFDKALIKINTQTVEGFGRDFARRCMEHEKGKCLVYVVDSLDSLGSEKSHKRFVEAARKDKAEDGSYGEKAAYLSKSFFDNIVTLMENKDITLIIVSQIREIIGAMTYGKKYKRAGGKAMDFYAHQVVWLYGSGKINPTRGGIKRITGVNTIAKVEKNKVSKPWREANFSILFDYGVDDLSSMIEFIFGGSTGIEWEEKRYTREKFIALVEEQGLEGKLKEMAEKKWLMLEEKFKPKRKRRFGG